MSQVTLFQVEISKGYGLPEWREDLKNCLLNAGLKKKPTTFLFSDTQIVVEVSERSERALRKMRILVMNQSREMATDIMATSTTELTHSILFAPSSLGVDPFPQLPGARIR